ncbi:hypothetical protein LCGC14_1143930 [marine sediment metagenome]|uniref:Uncharacterized protein n=1 Tax=marine sediment metagenome TaxID=412755 RepID=A0A0F9MKI9_9ZZZZ
MDLLLSLIFTVVGFGLIILYIYSFVLLWTDKQFEDLIKILGTVLFLVFPVASWVYLFYRMFRS